MNHSGEVTIHGRIIEVRYITVPLVGGVPDIEQLEDDENNALRDGFQPFGKPDYIDDLGIFIQKMVRRS